MEITVFAKKRTATDGRTFNSYFGKLTKKTGEVITAQIKFRDECGAPSKCPCNIIVNHSDCNYSEKQKTYTDATTQEQKETTERVLWVSGWSDGAEYVDTSMDEFVD